MKKITNLPAANVQEHFLDVLWRRKDRHGADLLRVRTDGVTTTVDTVATITWDPQYSDGWRRYAWDLPPRRPDQIGTLVLIGSPEVEITPGPMTATPALPRL